MSDEERGKVFEYGPNKASPIGYFLLANDQIEVELK
jgi:hypothetical protein